MLQFFRKTSKKNYVKAQNRNINFWNENDLPLPFWKFFENSSILVARPIMKNAYNGGHLGLRLHLSAPKVQHLMKSQEAVISL